MQNHDAWCSSLLPKVIPPDQRARPKDIVRTKAGLLARVDQNGVQQVLVPLCLRGFVLERHHGLPVSGHLCANKTYDAMRSKYFWKGMLRDVVRWIKSCLTCAIRKTPRNTNGVYPGVVCDTPHPWHTLAIDIVSPKETTPDGYTKILSVIDLFTRWTLAIPIRRANADCISKALFKDVFCIFGKPTRIISDNGSEFLNKHVEQMLGKWNIKAKFTGGYQPQANPVERYHRFLNSTMTMLCSSYGANWAEYLPAAVFAYNSSTCASTGYAPYELLFCGRKPTLLLDIDLSEVANEVGLPSNPTGPTARAFHQESQNRLAKAYIHARDQQAKMSQRNRKLRAGNLTKRNSVFKVGDNVLFWEPQQTMAMDTDADAENPSAKRPAKWTPKWTGPHNVTAVATSGDVQRYTIFHKDRGKSIENVNPNRLWFFQPWSSGISSTSFKIDIKRKYRTGEWVRNGSLVLVPILNSKCPFGVAKLLACSQKGDLKLQWYGNKTDNPNGTFHPGWWTTKKQSFYYAKTPKQLDHEPFLADDSKLRMHQRDVALHDFELTKTGRIPAQLHRQIKEMPEFNNFE